MKRNIVLILSIGLSILIFTGCKDEQNIKNTSPKTDVKTEEIGVIEDNRDYGNTAGNIAKGGNITLYKNKYYYSEYKDGGKLYFKCKGDNEGTKINDDIASSINAYKDKLYYVNTKEEGLTELVVMDIDNPESKKIKGNDVMSILIKDNKLISIYAKEELSGHMEGYRAIEAEVENLETGNIEIYKLGYGNSTIIDEERFINFSTMIGNYISNKEDLVFPKNNEFESMITLIDTNNDLVYVHIDEFYGKIKSGIYEIDKENNYKFIVDGKDGVVINDILYYLTEDGIYSMSLKDNIKTKLMDYKSNNVQSMQKIEEEILIFDQNGNYNSFNIKNLEKNINQDIETNVNLSNNEEKILDNQLNDKRSLYISKLEQLEIELNKVHDDYGNGYSSTSDYVVDMEYMYNKYDDLINEIYSDLRDTLSSQEMSELKSIQLGWISEKERRKEQALKNEAGAHINWVEIGKNDLLIEMTKERCYELVNYFE